MTLQMIIRDLKNKLCFKGVEMIIKIYIFIIKLNI